MSQDDGASVDHYGDRRYASGYTTGHVEGMEELLRMISRLVINKQANWQFDFDNGDVHWWLIEDCTNADDPMIYADGETAQSLIDYVKQEHGK